MENICTNSLEHDLRKDPDNSNAAKRTVIEIEEITIHEDYSKFRQGGVGPNDIALIRVKQPIPFYNLRKNYVLGALGAKSIVPHLLLQFFDSQPNLRRPWAPRVSFRFG